MRKVIIDTDTATDDAIAIIMALKYNDFEINKKHWFFWYSTKN